MNFRSMRKEHCEIVAEDKHYFARGVFEIGFICVSDLRIYVRHIKMELAAEACNFNIHTSSRPSNYGLFMALKLCSKMWMKEEENEQRQQ